MKVMRRGNNTEQFVVIWQENRFLFGADFIHMSFLTVLRSNGTQQHVRKTLIERRDYVFCSSILKSCTDQGFFMSTMTMASWQCGVTHQPSRQDTMLAVNFLQTTFTLLRVKGFIVCWHFYKTCHITFMFHVHDQFIVVVLFVHLFLFSYGYWPSLQLPTLIFLG